MSDYVKQTWVDETGVGDGTLITAAKLNHMEDGIGDASSAVPMEIAGGTTYAPTGQALFHLAIHAVGGGVAIIDMREGTLVRI